MFRNILHQKITKLKKNLSLFKTESAFRCKEQYFLLSFPCLLCLTEIIEEKIIITPESKLIYLVRVIMKKSGVALLILYSLSFIGPVCSLNLSRPRLNGLIVESSSSQKKAGDPRNFKDALELEEIPEYVFLVLEYIEMHDGIAPEGYVGGRIFSNYDRSLPSNLQYREYDVHPWHPKKNRGPERLVRGNNNAAWYTSNHYRSFVKIK